MKMPIYSDVVDWFGSSGPLGRAVLRAMRVGIFYAVSMFATSYMQTPDLAMPITIGLTALDKWARDSLEEAKK